MALSFFCILCQNSEMPAVYWFPVLLFELQFSLLYFYCVVLGSYCIRLFLKHSIHVINHDINSVFCFFRQLNSSLHDMPKCRSNSLLVS